MALDCWGAGQDKDCTHPYIQTHYSNTTQNIVAYCQACKATSFITMQELEQMSLNIDVKEELKNRMGSR